jgi:UDP-N-acetylglucosamine:LPS N-acetylglucosamine transferase
METAHPSAVVLSGSIGAGHDTVAEVCSEALSGVGVPATTVDCMGLLGGWPHRIGTAVFQRLLANAPAYDAFHFNALRGGTRLARLMDRGAVTRLLPAIEERAAASPGGLLLSVFATGSGTAAALRERHPQWRTATFCTDASAHQMWVHDGIERYFVCSPGAAGTVRQYDPTADVVELPPPVRAPFFRAPTRADARRRLSLDSARPHVLISGGAWGRGPLAETAIALADAGYHAIVVAGRNRRLAAQIEGLAARRRSSAAGGLDIFGFVDDMPLLMAASDVIVTSPGQTCHEARVVNRPMVLLDTVPGHGRENLLIELAAGGAVAAIPDTDRVVRAVDAVVQHDIARPTGWPVRDPAAWHRQFVAAIADLLPAASDLPTSAAEWTAAVTWTRTA